MPRYYFNIDNGQAIPDVKGIELKNLAAAKCEAIQMAGRLICDAAATFWDRAEWSMTVTDATGLTLFRLEIMGTEAPAAQLTHPRSAELGPVPIADLARHQGYSEAR